MSDFKTRIKLSRMRRNASDSHTRLFYIMRGVLISLVITIPVILITSGASYLTEFPEEYISPIAFTSMILSVFLASFLSSAWQKNCGWSNGTLIGGIYMLMIVVLRSFFEGRVCIDKDSITMLLFGMLIGSLSGYAGLKFVTLSRNKK